jgi:hypothetical protein
MNHADVEDGRIADPLCPYLEGNADDTVREFRIVFVPMMSLARVLVGHGYTRYEKANHQSCRNMNARDSHKSTSY